MYNDLTHEESNHKKPCSFCLEYDYAENMYNTYEGYLCEYCGEDVLKSLQ